MDDLFYNFINVLEHEFCVIKLNKYGKPESNLQPCRSLLFSPHSMQWKLSRWFTLRIIHPGKLPNKLTNHIDTERQIRVDITVHSVARWKLCAVLELMISIFCNPFAKALLEFWQSPNLNMHTLCYSTLLQMFP